MARIGVMGAGGALGGWLAKRLVEDGHDVRAVDIKRAQDWFQAHEDSSIWEATDLRDHETAHAAVGGMDWIFNLACEMGGIGFIETNRADCASSVLINTNLLRACRSEATERYWYASSACIYSAENQATPEAGYQLLKEEDAYPVSPEAGYGEEKWFSERLCLYAAEDWGLKTRISRLHNVMGPHSTWDGGREKAPAALCRKVATAKLTGTNELLLWGDGSRTRSFLDVEDFVEGALRIMGSDYGLPVNLGSSEVVTVNQLADIVEEVAGTSLKRVYDLTMPQGVQGRGSDNDLLQRVTGWLPKVSLKEGISRLYPWVEHQVKVQLQRDNPHAEYFGPGYTAIRG